MEQAPPKSRVPNAGSFKPGVSGNPNGRPRAGLALAERIRERVSPDLLIDLVLQAASDESLTHAQRVAVLLPVVQLGYYKPPTNIAATIETSSSTTDWGSVPIEKRRELLASIQAAREAADPRSSEARVPDDEEA